MQANAIIFDYGCVLASPPTEADFAALAHTSTIPAERFPTLYWHHRLAYDCLALDGPAYWQAVAALDGLRLDDQRIQRLIEQDVDQWSVLYGSMMAFVRQVRAAGMRTALLSNMPADLGDFLRERSRLFSYFDHITLSCAVGAAKPDARIYEHCLAGLAKFGVRPEQALFIDDRLENLEAAAALGIRTYLFHTPERFAQDVLALELPGLDLGLPLVRPHALEHP